MSEGGGRILVVDDEESIRRNLRVYLEDEGFVVSTAESGEEALKMLAPSTFEAAIVDIRLPGMDGNAFIEHAHQVDGRLNFLIFTGSVGYQLPERLAGMGVRPSQIFMKPLNDMTVMAESLRGLLARREKEE